MIAIAALEALTGLFIAGVARFRRGAGSSRTGRHGNSGSTGQN